MSTHNLCFEQKYEKYFCRDFYLKIFSFFGGEIFYLFEWACFRNVSSADYAQTLVKVKDNVTTIVSV